VPVGGYYTRAKLAAEVVDQKLLHDVFSARHHRELVRCSTDVLRLLSQPLPGATVDAADDDAACYLDEAAVADIWSSVEHTDDADNEAGQQLLHEVRSDLPPSVRLQLLSHLLRSPAPLSARRVQVLKTLADSEPGITQDLATVAASGATATVNKGSQVRRCGSHKCLR
jgi:hypothetical protein